MKQFTLSPTILSALSDQLVTYHYSPETGTGGHGHVIEDGAVTGFVKE